MDTHEFVKLIERQGDDLKKFIDRHNTSSKEMSSRLLAVEQRLTAPGGGPSFGGDFEGIGSTVIKSDGYSALTKGARSTGQIQVGQFHKTTIVNATGQNQPLVQDYRVPGIVAPGQQRLMIRDLLPQLPTTSNLVQYTKESSSTNAAASQTGGSPNSGENVAKAESALGFTLANAPVQTIATWIPASKQVVDDSTSLQAYINTRLTYFLKLQEEQQLLNGSGTGNTLSGLIANSTTYDTAFSVTATDTFIDTISHAIVQVQNNSNFEADGIVLNNLDWETILLTKTTGTASSGQYIYADPHNATGARLWGLPVVPTKSMARSQFLVGAFRMGAAIWDRNDATVEVSREHSDFFVKNLVAILVEERLALTVYRSDAFVYGGFPYGS